MKPLIFLPNIICSAETIVKAEAVERTVIDISIRHRKTQIQAIIIVLPIQPNKSIGAITGYVKPRLKCKVAVDPISTKCGTGDNHTL